MNERKHFKECPAFTDKDDYCDCYRIGKADKDEIDEERGVEEWRASKEHDHE